MGVDYFTCDAPGCDEVLHDGSSEWELWVRLYQWDPIECCIRERTCCDACAAEALFDAFNVNGDEDSQGEGEAIDASACTIAVPFHGGEEGVAAAASFTFPYKGEWSYMESRRYVFRDDLREKFAAAISNPVSGIRGIWKSLKKAVAGDKGEDLAVLRHCDFIMVPLDSQLDAIDQRVIEIESKIKALEARVGELKRKRDAAAACQASSCGDSSFEGSLAKSRRLYIDNTRRRKKDADP